MEVNLVAVVLAAFSAFFLGFLWYTIVFAKPWQREIGMKDAGDVQTVAPDMGKMLGGSFVLEILMALGLATLIGKEADAARGLVVGLTAGFVVGFAFGVNYLFEGKTLKHWLINAAYNVVVFAIMGLIIGAM